MIVAKKEFGMQCSLMIILFRNRWINDIEDAEHGKALANMGVVREEETGKIVGHDNEYTVEHDSQYVMEHDSQYVM